jgi:hypothetical protein
MCVYPFDASTRYNHNHSELLIPNTALCLVNCQFSIKFFILFLLTPFAFVAFFLFFVPKFLRSPVSPLSLSTLTVSRVGHRVRARPARRSHVAASRRRRSAPLRALRAPPRVSRAESAC